MRRGCGLDALLGGTSGTFARAHALDPIRQMVQRPIDLFVEVQSTEIAFSVNSLLSLHLLATLRMQLVAATIAVQRGVATIRLRSFLNSVVAGAPWNSGWMSSRSSSSIGRLSGAGWALA